MGGKAGGEWTGQGLKCQPKEPDLKVDRTLRSQEPWVQLLTQRSAPLSKSPASLSWSALMGGSGSTPGPHVLLVHDHMGLGSRRTQWSRGGTCCGGELPGNFSQLLSQRLEGFLSKRLREG